MDKPSMTRRVVEKLGTAAADTSVRAGARVAPRGIYLTSERLRLQAIAHRRLDETITEASARIGAARALTPIMDLGAITRTDVAAVQTLFRRVGAAIQRANPDGDFIYSLCIWGAGSIPAILQRRGPAIAWSVAVVWSAGNAIVSTWRIDDPSIFPTTQPGGSYLAATPVAAYLAGQAQSYDRLVAHPLNIIALVVVCAFVVGGAVALYELLALGACKMLNKVSMNGGTGSDGYGLRAGGSEKSHE